MHKKLTIILLWALFFLPAGATVTHFRVHSEISWLPYLTIFDAVFVTLLFYFRKTSIYALFINSIFFIVGTGYHLAIFKRAFGDILLSLTDFLLGIAVYLLVNEEEGKEKI